MNNLFRSLREENTEEDLNFQTARFTVLLKRRPQFHRVSGKLHSQISQIDSFYSTFDYAAKKLTKLKVVTDFYHANNFAHR